MRRSPQVDLHSKFGAFSELYWSFQERKARLFLFVYRKWCVHPRKRKRKRERKRKRRPMHLHACSGALPRRG